MTLNDQKLLFRLKQLGLQAGSGDFRDYEKAKKMLQVQGLTPDEFEKFIKKTTDYLKCEL